MEFEWNIFPGFTPLKLVDKVQEFMNKKGDPEQFQGRIIFMSMFNDITWRTTDNKMKDNEKECVANSTLVSCFAKRFSSGRWSFLGPGSETEVVYSRIQTTKRMGQSRRADDDQVQ